MWDGVGLATLGSVLVLLWRILIVERTLHERVDEIDRSLGAVVGMIIEKMDSISSSVPDINLINQNPIGQIIEFLKGNAPAGPDQGVINSQPPPKGADGQFVEVEPLGKTEKTN